MDGVGDFEDRVGTSPQVLKLPHATPTEPAHHAANAREIERTVNEVPITRPYLYQNRTALTVPGDGSSYYLPQVRIPEGDVYVEAWIRATSVDPGTIDSLYYYFEPTPPEVQTLLYPTAAGFGTDELTFTVDYHVAYRTPTNMKVRLTVDTSDNSDVALLWSMQVTRVKAYLF